MSARKRTKITYVPRKVSEEVESIIGTLPGKVYYSEDGEALILTDGDRYIISVSPDNGSGFNDGNPVTSSAYLVSQPVVDIVHSATSHHEPDAQDARDEDIAELEGWTTGWEC